ncbi:hypothetical protein C8P63_12339 [Melghirimyces profundicolus]|uniref:Uncharacterized protein n=1 Tax=Melghirimyces profundicolus TaxID=1242148 RepID=A0A2T6BG36_9BACL|nr:hypothetical protein C8P63_12339 [Melghirimyces profundicolus]
MVQRKRRGIGIGLLMAGILGYLCFEGTIWPNDLFANAIR